MSLEPILGRAPDARREDGEHWLSVSDLMSGLMILFLFISIAFMRHLEAQRTEAVEERDRVQSMVVIANNTQVAIYEALREEFQADLLRWNAELDRDTLTVRFRAPDILFDRSSDELKPEFRAILADFFPRYMARLDQFHDAVAEIRIEGHTSSEWSADVNADEAYFRNMALSQSRTRSVLRYCKSLPHIDSYPWLRDRMAAVGLSSSRLVRRADGSEDAEHSRRVEFRVQTNFEKRMIQAILPGAG